MLAHVATPPRKNLVSKVDIPPVFAEFKALESKAREHLSTRLMAMDQNAFKQSLFAVTSAYIPYLAELDPSTARTKPEVPASQSATVFSMFKADFPTCLANFLNEAQSQAVSEAQAAGSRARFSFYTVFFVCRSMFEGFSGASSVQGSKIFASLAKLLGLDMPPEDSTCMQLIVPAAGSSETGPFRVFHRLMAHLASKFPNKKRNAQQICTQLPPILDDISHVVTALLSDARVLPFHFLSAEGGVAPHDAPDNVSKLIVLVAFLFWYMKFHKLHRSASRPATEEEEEDSMLPPASPGPAPVQWNPDTVEVYATPNTAPPHTQLSVDIEVSPISPPEASPEKKKKKKSEDKGAAKDDDDAVSMDADDDDLN